MEFMEPIPISSDDVRRIHDQNQCVCVREDHRGVAYAHCIKFSTNKNNRYLNTIGDGVANVPMNQRTPRENKLVQKSNASHPLHVITYSGGPGTLYHGRYVCEDPGNHKAFVLRYHDRGIADGITVETKETRRSPFEEAAERFFETRGFRASYEPCQFPWGHEGRNYTPDFYIPRAHCFVEIKGFMAPDGNEAEPTQETLAKCQAVSQKGFAIVLVQGDVGASPVFHFWEPFSTTPAPRAPWWWGQENHNKRRRQEDASSSSSSSPSDGEN